MKSDTRGTKGGLSLFNCFIDMSSTLYESIFGKKTCFEGKTHVFLTKNGLIRVGLMSIKQLNKERQPLVGWSISTRD